MARRLPKRPPKPAQGWPLRAVSSCSRQPAALAPGFPRRRTPHLGDGAVGVCDDLQQGQGQEVPHEGGASQPAEVGRAPCPNHPLLPSSSGGAHPCRRRPLSPAPLQLPLHACTQSIGMTSSSLGSPGTRSSRRPPASPRCPSPTVQAGGQGAGGTHRVARAHAWALPPPQLHAAGAAANVPCTGHTGSCCARRGSPSTCLHVALQVIARQRHQLHAPLLEFLLQLGGGAQLARAHLGRAGGGL